MTRADVHNEQSPVKQQTSTDPLPPYPENGNVSHSRQPSEEFPPPPYPIVPPVAHSRQASEDFPPPPPPIEDNNHNQIGENSHQQQQAQSQQQLESQQITILLAQLKLKREQMLASEAAEKQRRESLVDENEKAQNETWLRELQAKQAERRTKKQGSLDQDIPKVRSCSMPQVTGTTVARRTSDLMMNTIMMNQDAGRDVPDCPRTIVSSVKDMAAKFEQKVEVDVKPQSRIFSNSPTTVMQGYPNSEEPKMMRIPMDNMIMMQRIENEPMNVSVNPSVESNSSQVPFVASPMANGIPIDHESGLNAAIRSMLTLPHENGLPVDCPEDDISEVAMQNTIQNTKILATEDDIKPKKSKERVGKKKSVSFCDQVVLVATAEDDEKDSYIPNPILERILRSAKNKPETAQVRREIKSLQEAELNREMVVPTKFQQHTLPLKSEADSIPATPYQDQLRSVITASETSKPAFPRQNSSEAILQDNKKMYPAYGPDSVDITRESYSTIPNNPARATPTPMSPQLQGQIRYTQNGYPQPQQMMPSQNQNMYPQVQTAHPRNQNMPLSQSQKPASPYPMPMQGQYIQNGIQQKNNSPKNMHPSYYQLEQQNNQMNRQLSAQQQQQQQQNIMNQRLQTQTPSPITVQQQQQRLHSQNASPITVQQHQQQLGLPNGQSTSPYPQYSPQTSQYSHNSYQGHPYQSVPQQRSQPLPQYQPPPNPSAQQGQQQNLQNGSAVAYQQRLENNFQRQPQKIEQHQQQQQQQVMHPQGQQQGFPNGQMPPNIKYPTYQHVQQTKQMKPIQQQQQQQQMQPQMQQQMHMVQGSMKGSPVMNQNLAAMQKSSISGVPKVAPCQLCGKKQVCEPATYCYDCDFYMSRFRPKN